MKIWHVTFTSHGFNLDAVVVAPTYGEAVAMLKLDNSCHEIEALCIGVSIAPVARIVTEDKLETA